MTASLDDPQIQITIAQAELIGTCEHCDQPTVGSYDCEVDETAMVEMECANCQQKFNFIIDSPFLWGWLQTKEKTQ